MTREDAGPMTPSERLRDPTPLALGEPLAFWRQRIRDGPGEPAEFYRLLGERILRAGEPVLAYDVLTEGLERWAGDVRLRQLLGLALARSGAPERAQRVLADLRQEGHQDTETLGLLARTHKDLSALAEAPAARAAHLRLAAEIYEQAYRAQRETWPGINAATTALLLGEVARARALAAEVRQACRSRLDRDPDDYWAHATVGEAALILEAWEEARAHYAVAGRLGRHRIADLSTTRRQARQLVTEFGRAPEWLEDCLRLPRVVTFSGHMVDRPGRARPRFPAALEPVVAGEIAARLERLDVGFGYASAACGSDILFLEAVLARGGEIHIVLPFAPKDFRKTSVDIVPDGTWGERFERVLARAAQVVVAGEPGAEVGGALFEYGNLLVEGLAILRAEALGTELVPMVVWDARPGDGPGGTEARVGRWQRQGRAYEHIDLSALVRAAGFGEQAEAGVSPVPARREAREPGVSPAPAGPASGEPGAGSGSSQRIMAMLFADAVGFSKLTEASIPAFVRHFLGQVGELAARSRHAPLFRNTWGDGLFFVFGSVEDAAWFAIELQARLGATNFAALGLPASLGLRIGLHAGPVYAFTDPVTGVTNYFGAHVSRAARIEPIAPPGQVYASQSFAALASARIYASQPFVAVAQAEGVRDFRCEYVGQVPLAKGYGAFPMYHVRPRSERSVAQPS